MNKILLLGLSTLLIFGLGGVLIIEYYHGLRTSDILLAGWSIPSQLLTGVIYGLVSSAICLIIINSGFFQSEKEFYAKKIGKLNLNIPNILFLSMCAGIGEEMFFRAAIQPILGIWPTSLFFVLIHGYLNPRNWRISIYGIAMVVIIAGIGYLYVYIGLITVITAHTVIDVVLLMKLKKELEESKVKL